MVAYVVEKRFKPPKDRILLNNQSLWLYKCIQNPKFSI